MMQGTKIVKTARKPVSKSWNKIIKRNLMEPSNDWSLSTLLYNYKISWEWAESLYNMAFKDNVQIPLVTKDQILEVLEMAQEKKNLINTQKLMRFIWITYSNATLYNTKNCAGKKWKEGKKSRNYTETLEQ